ncbi:tetratricopeptide repeat protein [Marinobacter sp. 1Y8]
MSKPVSLSFLNKAVWQGAALAAALSATGPVVADDDLPERAQDLRYGAILYDYYQGKSFDALTRMAVAERDGGIKGHGDHPLLVKGGLMLAYGMTREARGLFEQLLTEDIPAATRSQAWFYLGKVFYLEGDNANAIDALNRVDPEAWEDEEEPLTAEWHYLKGQLALRAGTAKSLTSVKDDIDALSDTPLWQAYLRYNLSALQLDRGQAEEGRNSGIQGLERLTEDLDGVDSESVADLEEDADDPESFDELALQREQLALRERALLSLGQIYQQQGDTDLALARLSEISLTSAFSDEALYRYSVAASEAQSWGLALQALNTLQERPLFTPWLQQVPYARGFVFEQLDQQKSALQAYRAAANHYQTLLDKLVRSRQSLTEAGILAALRFEAEGASADSASSLSPGQQAFASDDGMTTDAYGRLNVQPDDFNLALLLSSEKFQLALRDLHELYQLRIAMTRWQRQLASFDVMLDTRAEQRRVKIEQTETVLASLGADEWTQQQATFNAAIEAADQAGDAAFFMSDEQKAFAAHIRKVEDTLAALPNDDNTAAQREKIRRIKAYFDWQVSNQYAVNRWAAQKQLRELNQAMDTFGDKNRMLAREISSDDRTAALAERVKVSQQRIASLDADLDNALNAARDVLIGQVSGEIARQESEVKRYLLAARHAQARLSDLLFQSGSAVMPETPVASDISDSPDTAEVQP